MAEMYLKQVSNIFSLIEF